MKKLFILFVLLSVFASSLFADAYLAHMFASGFVDTSGDPMVGGKVYVYSSGTTTYKESWQDREETLVNFQPVILDSYGAAQIYCRGIYKFVLYDSDDTLIATWDGVDFRYISETSIELSNGLLTTVSFNGDGNNYINSGNLGIGMTVPTEAVHIYDSSPAIILSDSTSGKIVKIQNDSSTLKIRHITGTSNEVLLDIPVSLQEAPTGPVAFPVGVIMPYCGTTEPSGWLFCDGAAISRTTYSQLYTAIGTKFGVGDGSTTFNLPNLHDKYLTGASVEANVGYSIAQRTAMPSGFTMEVTGAHTHNIENLPDALGSYSGASANGWLNSDTKTTGSGGDHTHDTSGWDSITRPPSIAINYIVYTGRKY